MTDQIQQDLNAAYAAAGGDPAAAAELFTEAYQQLGKDIGGDVGAEITQLAPGLGQATADVAVITAGALDGNDQAVSAGEADLVRLEGDGLSSLGQELEYKVFSGQLGAGIANVTGGIDHATQTFAFVDKFVTDFQKGDGLAAVQDLSGALHHAGGALDDAGHALQDLGAATGVGFLAGLGSDADAVLGGVGDALYKLGDVTDKASAGIGELTNLAEAPAQIVGIMTDDAAKTAEHLGKDAWDGLNNVGGDLFHGNVGGAICAAGATAETLAGDLANGLGDFLSDGWDDVKHLADGIGSFLGLGGGGDNHPKGNIFQDGDPSSLPEGVYQGYGAPDSDGNMPVIYAAANGADSVDYDPSTGGFTEYNGNGIVARPRPNHHHQRRLRASAGRDR